ncbi:MAG: hypothetical protein CVU05_06005 [Bacteroidetes bacterium HGW-Bacteroidetes-21]|nr:MAG: hypothetical protein CVU05_06005 [Bacteroidetes bacterium HGW-Bacteroidetes-21]
MNSLEGLTPEQMMSELSESLKPKTNWWIIGLSIISTAIITGGISSAIYSNREKKTLKKNGISPIF